jgi:pSer/pThr/pTyr-binding forkhead associated (FHA) protein
MPKLKRRDTGEELPLADGLTRIGRRSASEVQVNEKHVSRLHCRIEGPAGGWTIADAGSKIGTFVNGRRVRRHRLQAGDEIKVGAVVFVFQETGPTAAEGGIPHVQPLSDSAAIRVLPDEERDHERKPKQAAEPKRRRILPVLVGVVLAAAGIGVLAAVLGATRQTPEKTVRHAAELLRRRDGAALWKLVSGERKIEMTEQEFKEQVDAVPNEVVVALETLEVGRARQTDRGIVVPISVTVKGERLDDEVILYREDGRWRICAVPVERASELGP